MENNEKILRTTAEEVRWSDISRGLNKRAEK